jgi:hypothetical protein
MTSFRFGSLTALSPFCPPTTASGRITELIDRENQSVRSSLTGQKPTFACLLT